MPIESIDFSMKSNLYLCIFWEQCQSALSILVCVIVVFMVRLIGTIITVPEIPVRQAVSREPVKERHPPHAQPGVCNSPLGLVPGRLRAALGGRHEEDNDCE